MPLDFVPENELPKEAPEPASSPTSTFDDILGSLPDEITSGPAFPETAAGFGEAIAGSAPLDTPASPEVVRKKRVKMSKAMKKSMDALKANVADIPIMWFHDQSKNHPEWTLDPKEEEWLRDSFSTVFEVLDIELEIQPLSYTLTSIWWVLAYPVVTFLFLFVTKKGKSLQDGNE